MLGLSRHVKLACALVLAAACTEEPAAEIYCQPGLPYCVDANGQRVCPGGGAYPECASDGGGDTDVNDTGDGGDGGDGRDDNDTIIPTSACECTASPTDSDGDCVPDNVEPAGNTGKLDADGDGINDGCEDRNRNGSVNPGESNPSNIDSDADGIPDGIEDTNHDGVWQPGETKAVNADSDGDGINDGLEDKDHDGVVDAWADVNGDGCFAVGVDTAGETDPRDLESDGDLLLDAKEDKNKNGQCDVGETCSFVDDTDCDGILDGKEDLDLSGSVSSGESNPLNPDSDGDGIRDGLEDRNKNGVFDVGSETSPLLVDSDEDGIRDDVEDADRDGRADPYVDVNGDGCFTPGVDTGGESDPRFKDSDVDGVPDNLEDLDRDGVCDIEQVPNPVSPGNTRLGLVETCAFVKDSECDGVDDGREDVNHNGRRDIGELDARYEDSDYDGLVDGCPTRVDVAQCEDKNNNGEVDPSETDPRNADTDYDFLPDGCEVNFEGGALNPLLEDTDGDGTIDGEEDANHNCRVDAGEDSPLTADPAPPTGTEARAEYEVCASQNLKKLTFAASSRTTQDYRVAFEVERGSGGEAAYLVRPFGLDLDGGGFDSSNIADSLWGHIFQSPAGVVQDPGTQQLINRDVYGFVLATEDTGSLDDILDDVRANLQTLYPAAVGGPRVREVGALTARPAHDSSTNYRVFRAQRQFEVSPASPYSTTQLRNEVLRQLFLPQDPAPAGVIDLNAVDPVYGPVVCPNAAQCFSRFTVDIAAVQRLDQDGPTGEPVILLVVAITPDTRNAANPNDPASRLYADRLTRLEDLTGGSAVARFEARLSSTCERKEQKEAKADILWVVDDSRSMQQIIGRLQQASKDAKAVLTANSNIVDFRLAMTTTNPSQNARKFCPDDCTASCGGPNCGTQGASGITCTSGSCMTCSDTALTGCIKVCPTGCSTTCTGASCPPSLSTCVGACECTGSCVAPASIGGALTADLTTYPLPGGGGTFYYEDSAYLDCSSASSNPLIDPCNAGPYATEFAPFFNAGARKVLAANAGFLGSDAGASCASALMDLTYDAALAGTQCAANSAFCCERLTAACSDGPTVLASQMCDLIRAMGGKPPDNTGVNNSTRMHASPESGTRSARRLIDTMIPALPLDYTGPLDPREHLRLDCSTSGSGEACTSDSQCGRFDRCQGSICVPTGNCVVCDPRNPPAGASGNTCSGGTDAECGRGERCQAGVCKQDCAPVPLLTVFLSDEEDFYFKDECANRPPYVPGDPRWVGFAARETDRSQLPQLCRYKDGNPATEEPCYDDADNPLAYCTAQGFLTNWPAGYDPDDAPAYNPEDPLEDFSMKWRDANAPQCSPTDPKACSADPCRALTSGQCGSNAACGLSAGTCYNKCTLYTVTNNFGLNTTVAGRQAQRDACNADAACFFDQNLVTTGNSGQQLACVPKYPPNDCQPCKRLRRRVEAVRGGDGLVGFGDVGPVYSIVRQRGAQGAGGITGDPNTTADECNGGSVTWGRGDGSAYRDIAIDTFGRTQNVCSETYQDFMQLLVTDIVALSAPYPLAGSPIAATLKVGIARPSGGSTFEYLEVPRSRTSGFVYDGTTNSIGFKSDPVDGSCGGAACAQNGTIEATEINYARTAPHVPREGDVIFVSYRYWRPVPCNEECADGEVCVRTICQLEETPSACPGGQDTECVGGRLCLNFQCKFDCTPGDFLDRCEPGPCGVCEDYNPSNGQCVPITDTCVCNPNNVQVCDPNGPNTCSVGLACDESCVCVRTPGCEGAFDAQGNVLDCDLAKQCCADRQLAVDTCPGKTQPQCTGACEWNAAGAQCRSRFAACCTPGETPECFTIPETGEKSLYCDPGQCQCEGVSCTGPGDCQPWQTCDTSSGVCTPACNPVTEYCCVDCGTGCECRVNPN